MDTSVLRPTNARVIGRLRTPDLEAVVVLFHTFEMLYADWWTADAVMIKGWVCFLSGFSGLNLLLVNENPHPSKFEGQWELGTPRCHAHGIGRFRSRAPQALPGSISHPRFSPLLPSDRFESPNACDRPLGNCTRTQVVYTASTPFYPR